MGKRIRIEPGELKIGCVVKQPEDDECCALPNYVSDLHLFPVFAISVTTVDRSFST